MSSMIMMAIAYGITPLMSTIISKEVNVQRTFSFGIKRASLLPADAQKDNITTSFSYIAYSHQYLNGSLPEFTSPDYAVLPFEPVKNISILPGEDWIANSTIYRAHLNCTPGTVEFFNSTVLLDPRVHNQTRVSSADGDCTFLVGAPRGPQYSSYSPYSSFLYNKGLLERELPSSGSYSYNSSGCVDRTPCDQGPIGLYNITCPKDDLLFAFFGRRTGAREGADPGDWMKWDKASATFCQPVHLKQDAEVVVDASTHAIKKITPFGSSTVFTGLDLDHWTNILTGFATSASNAKFNVSERKMYPEIGQASPSMGMTGWSLPEHTSELVKMPAFQTLMENYKVPVPVGDFVDYQYVNYTLPINVFMELPRSIMVFGLGKFGLEEQDDLEALLDPQNLGSIYSDAYTYLSAMLIQPELVNFDNDGPLAEAIRTYEATGYVVDAIWIRLLQAALAVILALNLGLAAMLYRRKCDIGGDPGSIASAMSAVDPCVLEDFEDAEFMDTKALAAVLIAKGHRYGLRNGRIVVCNKDEASKTDNSARPTVDRTQVSLSKPWDLTVITGIIATVILILGLVLLIVLYQKNRAQNGFPVPGNKFLYSLYANYLPTISASFTEAFLVLLANNLALLHPFKQLRRGYATAGYSLGVNYEHRPPHMQTFNALGVKNILLTALSVSILLANVLAVALGGLFHKEVRQYQDIGEVTLGGSVESLANFNSKGFIGSDNVVDSEFFYVGTGGNLQFEKRPWTTDELFYIPFFDPQNKTSSISTNYTVETVGLGVNITCEPIPAEQLSVWYSFEDYYNHTYAWTTFRNDNDTLISLPLYKFTDDLRGGLEYALWNVEGIWSTISNFWDNTTNPKWYLELAPAKYPTKLAESPVDFFGAWTLYERGNRTVEINRVDVSNLDSSKAELGKTITSLSAYMAKNVTIQCRPRPRIVRRKVTADLAGLIIDDTSVAESDETFSADFLNHNNETDLSGLLTAFHTMVLRGTWKDGVQFLDSLEMFETTGIYGTKNLTDPKPSNWLTFNLEQEAVKSNPDFDLYSFPEESARSMETVYAKLFAIYLQLHSDQIFPADQRSGTEISERMHRETRVVMTPLAFYVSIALLIVFIPIVIAVYFSLYSAFLVHSPTTLAGLYAAFYASSVVGSLSGTENIRSKERRKRLELLGNTYGYGWYVGKGGEKHVGIEKEPLLGRKTDDGPLLG
jgi:hypothetical protein